MRVELPMMGLVSSFLIRRPKKKRKRKRPEFFLCHVRVQQTGERAFPRPLTVQVP